MGAIPIDPAFPTPPYSVPGMNLADYFAARAPHDELCSPTTTQETYIYAGLLPTHPNLHAAQFLRRVAWMRYEWAAAMMAERERRGIDKEADVLTSLSHPRNHPAPGMPVTPHDATPPGPDARIQGGG